MRAVCMVFASRSLQFHYDGLMEGVIKIRMLVRTDGTIRLGNRSEFGVSKSARE